MKKRWVAIFKALGNINRIKIIVMLQDTKEMTVTDISKELGISLKATSRHLLLLQNFDVLESLGKDGFVYYHANKDLPSDFRKSINLFL